MSPRGGWRLLAAAWLVLAPTAPAWGQSLAIIPILSSPIQVLLAVLPAILAALAGGLVALLKPSAIKAGLKVLWRNKFTTSVVLAGLVGGTYLLRQALAGRGGGASAAVGGVDWPMMRGGGDRRAFSGDGPDPISGGTVWSFASEVKTFYSSPALVGNRLYVCSADKGPFSDRGAVYCLDADSGKVVWKYSPGNFRATYSSPAVWGRYLVCGEGLHFTPQARITCLDASTGGLLWELRTNSHVESSPCIAEGKVFIGAGDDGLYCLALEGRQGNSQLLWHLEGKDYPDCETSPLYHQGKVYFGLGEDGSAVVCVRAEDGQEVWRVKTPYPVFSSPVLAEGRLIVGMGNGNLIESAEVVRDKKVRQMRKEGLDEARIAEAVQGLGPAGEVWCLDPRNGAVLWKFPLAQTVLAVIAAAEGRIYFGSQDGLFHCLSADGQVVFQRDLHEPVVTSAAVGREHVYVVTDSGRLYALERLRNRLIWQATVGTAGPFLSSPAVGRGHVYVGTAQQGLVCLGQPSGAKALWAGYLGGPGQSGWGDGSPLPAQGNFAWRWPKDAQDGQAGVRAPAAYADGALYVALEAPGKVGLARIVISPQEDSPGGASTRPATRAAAKRRDDFAEQWFFPTSHPVQGSAAVGGGRVYFVEGQRGAGGRNLHCLEAVSGSSLWRRKVADDASGELLLTEQYLLVFDGAERLTCIQVSGQGAGEVLWSRPVRGGVGPPAVAEDMILLASDAPACVAAVSPVGGQTLWQGALGAPPRTGPAAVGDAVAVGTAEGLTVLSLADGSRRWTVPCGQVARPLACDEYRLVSATSAGEIVVFDWSGAELLRLSDERPLLWPMLAGEQLLFFSEQAVECVRLPAGRPAGQAATSSSPSSAGQPGPSRWLNTDWLGAVTAPAILVESNLYFATDLKGLVAARGRK